MNRRSAIRAIAVSALALSPFARAADVYPSRTIRIVLPGAAGTAGDRYARLIAKGLSDGLKQSVIVDNKPGAGGNIGAELVAKAPPDGYTLLFAGPSIFGINPHLYRKLSYNAMNDFIPIAPIVKGYMYLFIPATSPANTLADWMRMAKAANGRMSYGSPGIGSPMHVGMEWFKHKASVSIEHVPYKAGTPAIITALIAGEIDAAFDFYTPVMAQVKAGRLKALAITASARNPVVPDIPTFAEFGLPALDITGWAGLFAPSGTPNAIIELLNWETARAREGAEIQQTMATAGAIMLRGSPAEFKAFVAHEMKLGAELVRISGATLE